MRPYVPPTYRTSRPNLGAVSDMALSDWGLLLGGTIVGGAGINTLVAQFVQVGKKKKMNAVGIGLGVVFSGVGITVFVQEFRKLLA